MKKAMKTALKTLAVIVFIIVLTGFSIAAFVSWVWGGVRFTPEAAVEAISLGYSNNQYFEADDYRFYYRTLADDDWICDVTPVSRNAIGMYTATADPRSYPIIVEETGEYAGELITFESENCYYNFYIPPTNGYDPEAIPDFVKAEYDGVIVNGEEIELYKRSYFITETDIDEFEINEIVLSVCK